MTDKQKSRLALLIAIEMKRDLTALEVDEMKQLIEIFKRLNNE